MGECEFFEGVKFAAAGSLEGDIAFKKKINFTGERAAGLASAFSHRFDQAMRRRQPVDNEAGFSEARGFDHDGGGGLHHEKSGGGLERGFLGVKELATDGATVSVAAPCGAIFSPVKYDLEVKLVPRVFWK